MITKEQIPLLFPLTFQVPTGQAAFRVSFPQRYAGVAVNIRIENLDPSAIALYKTGESQPPNRIYPEQYVVISDTELDWIEFSTLSSSTGGLSVQCQLLGVIQ